MSYKIDKRQLKFLNKLRYRLDIEIKATDIHNTKSGFELLEILDNVIETGEYDGKTKLILNALRHKYKDKL